VNGGIHIEPRGSATSIDAINGGIQVQGGQVKGAIHTVNGGLDIRNGAEVSGDVANVNGGIHVVDSHVLGSIHTANGDVNLGPNAHIDGDVIIEQDNSSHFGDYCPPEVVVGPGSSVKGKLHFERKVRLYVSDRATIGPVDGAQPVKFSGDRPPADCSKHED
jgi:cytoskeletal protein CcmA (bactofilin family)